MHRQYFARTKIVDFTQVFASIPLLAEVSAAIIDAHGQAFVVGGAVRDALLGIPFKDIDIEVFGLNKEALLSCLQALGRVDEVGASFGIFKLTIRQAGGSFSTFDVSLPRREQKVSAGHRGFVVDSDHTLSFKEAANRRDFTINAMGYDLAQKFLCDPYKGQEDLEAGILRHVSDAFVEDPLRVLRAAQFCARFSLKLAPETLAACQSLQAELSSLPKERIGVELEKMLMAPQPSVAFTVLRETGALQLFPELVALIDCQQEVQWHPEGDVWVHTLMVVDEAAKLVRKKNLPADEALIIVLASLCHDLGKPICTKFEDGRIRSKNHDIEGEEPTKKFLQRAAFSQKISDTIVPLVREHLKPMQLYRDKEKVSDAAIKRLSARVSIEKLCLVATADFLGRTTPEALAGHDPSTEWLMQQAERLQVQKTAPEALLLGRHLLAAGMKPGPKMGKVLKEAYEAQLDGEFSTVEEALVWLNFLSFGRGKLGKTH